MRLGRLSCASAALAFGPLLYAGQTPPTKKAPPPPGTVAHVTVAGNRLYKTADIVRESGLHEGSRIDAASIDAARARLQATELFNSVAYEYRTAMSTSGVQYQIAFTVSENEQIFPIRFERLAVPDDTLRSCLREHVPLYADRIPATEGVLQRYKQALQNCAAAGNGHKPDLRAAVANDDPQQLAVVFSPNVPAPTISQVEVYGNQAVDTGTILRAVNQVAVGVPLSDTRLKLILEGAIRPLYAAKGYAAVSFPKIDTEPAKTNLGVVVKVQIHDGPAFKFGSIRFRGSGLDEDEIRSTIPFRTGQTFNGQQIDAFRTDLLRKMRHRGLLDAGINAETEPDDTKRAVNITYTVTPGAVYNFQTLDIRGLDVTTEPVVAKLWGVKPGHPFNPDYPDFFLKRVQEQGIFDNLADAHSDYSSDSSTHNVTVHLYFKGGKSRAQQSKEKKEEEQRRQGDGTWNPY